VAVKADIREELDRLTAHVQDARALLKDGKGVGASWISCPRNSTVKANNAMLQIQRHRIDPHGPGA